MSEPRAATDVDGRFLARVGAEGAVLLADLDALPPVSRQVHGLAAEAVLPGGRPGTFIVLGRGRAAVVEWHDDGVHTGAEAELPAGTRAVAADGPRIVAATDRALLGHDGGWSVLRPLAAAPLLLARQARRRSLLLLTEDGTVIGGAVDPARAGTHRDPSWAGAAVCAYDETLGAVWLAHPGGRAEAVLARVEPWPPRAVYRVPMPLGVEGLTVSHNGEWLAVRRGPGADGLELYNVAGRRVFRPPLSGLDGRIEVAFTYDNRLAAVDARDRVVVVELPARVDVRAEHRDLADLEVFWEGRMEKAARVRKANGGRRARAAAAEGAR